MRRTFRAEPGKGIIMSSRVFASEEFEWTEADVISGIRAAAKFLDYGCVIKNGGVQLSSYERDMYWFARLEDVVSYVNSKFDKSTSKDRMDWVDVIGDVGESVGASHAFELGDFKQDVKNLREKYLKISSETTKSYPKVLAKVTELFGALSDLGEDNGCPVRAKFDAKDWLKSGKLEIHPKSDKAVLKGRYGLFTTLYAEDGTWSDDRSKKMLRVVRQDLNQIRDSLDLPSLEMGRMGSMIFNLSDVE